MKSEQKRLINARTKSDYIGKHYSKVNIRDLIRPEIEIPPTPLNAFQDLRPSEIKLETFPRVVRIPSTTKTLATKEFKDAYRKNIFSHKQFNPLLESPVNKFILKKVLSNDNQLDLVSDELGQIIFGKKKNFWEKQKEKRSTNITKANSFSLTSSPKQPLNLKKIKNGVEEEYLDHAGHISTTIDNTLKKYKPLGAAISRNIGMENKVIKESFSME
jgi:hypothetical protein